MGHSGPIFVPAPAPATVIAATRKAILRLDRNVRRQFRQ
jgi:hypothetical protein